MMSLTWRDIWERLNDDACPGLIEQHYFCEGAYCAVGWVIGEDLARRAEKDSGALGGLFPHANKALMPEYDLPTLRRLTELSKYNDSIKGTPEYRRYAVREFVKRMVEYENQT